VRSNRIGRAPGACEQVGARRVVRLVVDERLGASTWFFGRTTSGLVRTNSHGSRDGSDYALAS
jgi:hypothetical protein